MATVTLKGNPFQTLGNFSEMAVIKIAVMLCCIDQLKIGVVAVR